MIGLPRDKKEEGEEAAAVEEYSGIPEESTVL